MPDKTFDINDIMQGVKSQKIAYQMTYDQKLKPLFERNPGEAAGLFLVRLKLYQKILSDLDEKIEHATDFTEEIRDNLDCETRSFMKGRISALMEMREYLDSRLCKLNNMADCIQENNPLIADAMIKERVS